MTPEETSEVINATRWASIVTHVKNNNIAYLLGVFMMHTAGATTAAVEYGAGICS